MQKKYTIGCGVLLALWVVGCLALLVPQEPTPEPIATQEQQRPQNTEPPKQQAVEATSQVANLLPELGGSPEYYLSAFTPLGIRFR